MSPRAALPVRRVTSWDGYCLPCGDDGRPLVLTWAGRPGLRAWLAGEGWNDGELRLTCVCCGGVDVVGWEDEPEPEVAAGAEPVLRQVGEPAAVVVPAPRAPEPPLGVADEDALDLLERVS